MLSSNFRRWCYIFNYKYEISDCNRKQALILKKVIKCRFDANSQEKQMVHCPAVDRCRNGASVFSANLESNLRVMIFVMACQTKFSSNKVCLFCGRCLVEQGGYSTEATSGHAFGARKLHNFYACLQFDALRFVEYNEEESNDSHEEHDLLWVHKFFSFKGECFQQNYKEASASTILFIMDCKISRRNCSRDSNT